MIPTDLYDFRDQYQTQPDVLALFFLSVRFLANLVLAPT
ncbi:hypothetical protein PsAD5_02422 [Pseudovibrio sp. Ad5]|nr:hypothetical protein PsAD5_02422 [Pseudovibrio sp. Ad5]